MYGAMTPGHSGVYDERGEVRLLKVIGGCAVPATLGACIHPDTLTAVVRLCLGAGAADGVVTDKQINEGDLANPGQPLLSVYDPKQLRLEVAVPARLIPLLSLGADVSVTLENQSLIIDH